MCVSNRQKTFKKSQKILTGVPQRLKKKILFTKNRENNFTLHRLLFPHFVPQQYDFCSLPILYVLYLYIHMYFPKIGVCWFFPHTKGRVSQTPLAREKATRKNPVSSRKDDCRGGGGGGCTQRISSGHQQKNENVFLCATDPVYEIIFEFPLCKWNTKILFHSYSALSLLPPSRLTPPPPPPKLGPLNSILPQRSFWPGGVRKTSRVRWPRIRRNVPWSWSDIKYAKLGPLEWAKIWSYFWTSSIMYSKTSL